VEAIELSLHVIHPKFSFHNFQKVGLQQHHFNRSGGDVGISAAANC
jgi:hypothetical protein